MQTSPRHVVVIGLPGSDPAATARLLRDRTGWVFAEQKDFSAAGGDTGSSSVDEEHQEWLDGAVAWLSAREQSGMSSVITAPPLTRTQRDRLGKECGDVTFAVITGPGHDPIDGPDPLEGLDDDEPVFVFSSELPQQELVDAIMLRLRG